MNLMSREILAFLNDPTPGSVSDGWFYSPRYVRVNESVSESVSESVNEFVSE